MSAVLHATTVTFAVNQRIRIVRDSMHPENNGKCARVVEVKQERSSVWYFVRFDDDKADAVPYALCSSLDEMEAAS